MKKRIALPGPLVIPSSASFVLDLMRVVAALLVLVSHLRALFFVDFGLTQNKSPLTKVFYLLTGLGHEAVVIFFVLSGLLVGMSVLRVHSRGEWSWTNYLLQRLTRLWIVLVPALILTFLWDWNGIRLFGPDSVYSGLPSDKVMISFNIDQRLDAGLFLGNTFFLQTLWCNTFGSNTPLWSLAFEFWYYIAFPCLVGLFLAPSVLSRCLYGLSLILISLFVGREVVFSFLLWLMGVGVLFLPGLWKNYRSASALWVGVSAVLLVLSLMASALRNNPIINYAIGLCCMLLMYCVFRLPQSNPATPAKLKSPPPGSSLLAKRLADFSYSVYLLHLPPLLFLHGLLWSRGISKWQPTPSNMGFSIVITLVVVAYAYLISLLTEAHTDKVRRWIKKKWFSPRSSPAV